MKFDELLYSHLGDFGQYQKLQLFLVCLPTLFTAMHGLSWTFSATDLPHRCRLPFEHGTVSFSPINCTDNDSCSWHFDECRRYIVNEQKNASEFCVDGYVYDHSNVVNSAINRWDIVCGKKVIKAVVQSMYYVGQFAGSLIFGILGDRCGRKKVFLFAIVLQTLSGTIMSFVPDWRLFSLLRIVVGFSHPGIFVIAVVIGMELVGPSHRKMAGVITGMFFSLGQCILGIAAYFLRDYQHLQLAISLPALIFIIYWWIVPESARWLISLGRYEEADKILQKAARMNGTQLPDRWWETIEEFVRFGPHSRTSMSHFDDGILLVNHIFTDIRLPPSMTCRPVVSMIYYGVSMNPEFLGGGLYGPFIVGALIEIPALVFVFLFIDLVGRKSVLAGGYFLASCSMFANLFIPEVDNVTIKMLQYMIAKASITCTYAAIYTFTPELFPTVVRNTALGFCSMIARFGAVFASYIAFWLVQIDPLLMIIPFGSLASLAGVAVLLLPETNCLALPETIEQVENDYNIDREMQVMIDDRAEL